MRFHILFFFALVFSSYSQIIPTEASEKTFSHAGQQFWSDVINEVSDDVNGASQCVSAVETFVAENPEVVAVLAKRSIPDHVISKRGVFDFAKKWYNKLNPIKYFYDCAMFLKDKGTDIYRAIEHPEIVKEKFTQGMKDTARQLSEVYQVGLSSTVQSADKVKSYLEDFNSNEISHDVLYQTIDGVRSNLSSYAAHLRKEDMENIFLDIPKTFPQLVKRLSELNWVSLVSLKLQSPIKTVMQFANQMHRFHLAHNMMLIMKKASQLYRKFATEEYPQAKNLVGGVNCINFLLNTTQFHLAANSLSDIGKFKYLEQARKCATFVAGLTMDSQDYEQKSIVLTNAFIESMNHSSNFLRHFGFYLYKNENPVKQKTGEKQLLRKAVTTVRKHLDKCSRNNKLKEFLQDAFMDVVQALDRVREMMSDWSMFAKDEKRSDTTFAPQMYFERVNNLMSQFSVIPSVGIAHSFFNLLTSAT